jgi:hypothetical protein
MIIERTKRRESFDERNAVPIRLADGQRWFFPKPWLEIRATFEACKARSTYPVVTNGPELDALIKAIGECRDDAALLCGVASLGAFLVSHNYDLSDEDLDCLFAFRIGDPASSEWAREVMDVATGRSGPKAGSGGAS